MLFSCNKHSKEEEVEFLNLLQNEKIYPVFHSEKTDEDSIYIQNLINQYFLYEQLHVFRELLKPPPFSFHYTTLYKRWCDYYSEKQNIITIG